MVTRLAEFSHRRTNQPACGTLIAASRDEEGKLQIRLEFQLSPDRPGSQWEHERGSHPRVT